VKKKIYSWLCRYLPAEVLGTIAALIAAMFVHRITNSDVAASLGGTWGENIGYYGYFLFKEVNHSIANYQKTNKRYRISSFLINIRNLAVEFGIPEWLDTGIIRPFLMFLFPKIVGNFPLGIIIGKIAADIVFYTGVIGIHEFRKKYMK
jgi:hypothetical protein